MEEKEQLRRQIRLLQGLIDDYKNHHSSASAPSRWHPSASSAYQSCRAFGTRYSRPSRRGFTLNHGPEWRKKYSLVNRPTGSLDQPGDGVPPPSQAANAGGSQEPDPLQCDPERQVQLNPDQNVIIKIKLSSPTGVGQGPLEVLADPCWSDPPQEGEGEPPVGPMLARGSGTEDPLLVCRKEPGKLRAVRLVSSGIGPSEPRRTVSESSLATRSCSPGASQYQRSSTALAWKGAPVCVGSCTTLILPGPGALPAPSGSAAPQEAGTLVSCRSSKFRRNNYKWVASSAKSPRPGRKAVSSRATEQARRELQAEPGSLSPSKYKWKASNPSISPSSSSFRWQPEAGSKSQVSLLAPVPSGSLPEESIREHPPSAYKVKSRTKIIRRRSCASLSRDKKTSPPPVTTTQSQFCLRRRQTLRPKSSPVLKRTPNRALMQLSRQRLGQLPAQAHLASKEVSSVQTLRTPPGSKVIKTRYRIVQKSSALPFSTPLSQAGSLRRLSLSSRSLVLNRLRPATGAGKAQPISPVWRNRGYRCIGGALYRVSANKLSRAASRQGDVGCRTPLRTGRPDSAGSCGRSLACRAVQRSLAIVRQARQRRQKKAEEYCMYYNRFGRCNRGQQCPYIHDPEKVAVCTRFLRGTCKKTDGTCPFSHQVAKEKMPVCSYFLKGICSNSSCPYSHVYVSRKAEVCAGFLKGYCPMGAKCKKKHTLLCPDFSRRGACPRGAQCQLLHRNQKRSCRRSAVPSPEPSSTAPRRNRVSTSHGPKKVSAAHRPSSRQMGTSTSAAAGPVSPSSPQAAGPSSSLSSRSPPRCHSPSLSSLDQEGLSPQEESAAPPGPGALSKLPSFISLRSSPSPGGQPTAQTPPSPALKESGKPLHIKPRL